MSSLAISLLSKAPNRVHTVRALLVHYQCALISAFQYEAFRKLHGLV